MDKIIYNEHFTTDSSGVLHYDGVNLKEMAQKYGTPLYVMSESTIRKTVSTFVNAMERNFGERCKVAYASKALCAGFLYKILNEERAHADVVSGGELYTALKAGFPAQNLHFHGNNKTDDEIKMAIECGIGSIIADSFEEIPRIDSIAGQLNKRVRGMLRIKPGIEAHTFEAVQTGQKDSKFGFGISDGNAMKASEMMHKASNIDFHGIHCHIGSQIFGTDSFGMAADVMIKLISEINTAFGIELPELILGGGFGIRYMPEDKPENKDVVIDAIGTAVRAAAQKFGLSKLPEIVIEPGRTVVGDAGCTLYTVGSVKDIEGARCYVSVDGGMTDNPRFALYEAQYDACVVDRADSEKDKLQTIAGRCCESGDMVSRDIMIQPAKAGDTLCVFATGAYNFSMASNYNRVPRPPIVLICEDGQTKVVVRRESYEDLIRNDIF